MTVEALLKFNGADASTVFTDDTSNQTWAVAGTGSICELDNTTVQEGTAALKIDQNSYVEADIFNDLSGAFTVEGWFYLDPLVTSGEVCLFEVALTPPYIWQVRYNLGTHLITLYSPYYGSLSVFDTDNIGPAWKPGNWIHLSFSRTSSNHMTAQINGLTAQNGWLTVGGAAFSGDITAVRIGGAVSFTVGMTGWCDGFRVSNEVLYPSGQIGLPPVDLGLTYTIQQPVYRIIDPLYRVNSDPIVVPFNGANPDQMRILILDSPCEAPASGGSGVQIWS